MFLFVTAAAVAAAQPATPSHAQPTPPFEQKAMDHKGMNHKGMDQGKMSCCCGGEGGDGAKGCMKPGEAKPDHSAHSK